MQSHQPPFHSSGNQHGQAQQPWGGPFPSLHMWPIQDTFQMKMIHLPAGQRVKIGRQTNNKTVPGERNAYFDSKVLSRTHAEIWEQGGKLWIKDVKSSNGTFINGVRLSPEGVESEPYELKSEDMVEFGIDIVSEDNRAIIHHKVSAKAYCVFGPDDAALSSRELAHYQIDPRSVRRPAAAAPPPQTGVNPLSQMGPAVMSAGGKISGLSFDHVLQKLQNELTKSKETSQELQGLNKAMTDVQDTLGGGLAPGQNGSAVEYIPAQFRNPSAEAQAALAGPHGPQAAAFIALQAQMTDTQSSLNGQLDRIRQLEGQLHQQEALKQELSLVRREMEESKNEMEVLLATSRRIGTNGSHHPIDVDDDDDDARSVATVVPDNDESSEEAQPSAPTADSEETPSVPNADLAIRIQSLTSEMEDALQLSRSLQAQHSEAMTTVKLLTDRLDVLENGVSERVSAAVGRAEERWENWRIMFEERWKKERDGWEAERERLRGVVREWEEASRRAVEEEEEREMNETLSDENDLADEEEDVGQEEVEAGELLAVRDHWPNGLEPTDPELDTPDIQPSRIAAKPRRRRPSTKTSLAMRGLRSVANLEGAVTPKAGLESSPVSETTRPRELRRDALNRAKRGRDKLARSSSLHSLNDKESSESGRESADTLRGDKDQVSDRKLDHHATNKPLPNSIPILTVFAVAAVAGVLYYRSKE